jgi:hypothetical protein
MADFLIHILPTDQMLLKYLLQLLQTLRFFGAFFARIELTSLTFQTSVLGKYSLNRVIPIWNVSCDIQADILASSSKDFGLAQGGRWADFHYILGGHSSFKEDLSTNTPFRPLLILVGPSHQFESG